MPTTPRILMCPPDHYGIEYEINPWMNRSLGAVRALAFRQWQQLHDTLIGLGVRVETMTPQPGLPDLVFTANAGLIVRNDVPQQPLPARGPRQGITPLRRLVPRAWLHGGASARGDVPRGGRRCALLRRDALRGLPHALGRAAHQWVGEKSRRPRAAPRTGQPALLPPRHLLLPARAGRSTLLPRRLRRLRPAQVLQTHVPNSSRSTSRKPSASAATRWSSARRSFTTAAARRWPRA